MRPRLLFVILMVAMLSGCGTETRSDPTAIAQAVNATIAALPAPTTIIVEATAEVEIAPTPLAEAQPTDTLLPEATAAPNLADSIPFRFPYLHSYTVKEQFDRFTGKTEVSLEPDYSEMDSLRQGSLWVYYSYDGQTPSVPPIIAFALWSMNDNWEYLNCHSLKLLVDDTPMSLDADHLGEVMSGSVSETVIAKVGVRDFLTIVNAKTVEGRLCNTEFKLSAEQQNALKDVASRMSTTTYEMAQSARVAETAAALPYDLALLRVDEHFSSGTLGVSGTFHNLGNEVSPPLVVVIAFKNNSTGVVVAKRQDIGSLAPNMSERFGILNETQGDWSYTISLETADGEEVLYRDFAQ